ncbi:MAG: protein tyrosine phosphatase [Proteobacteria bacterium]|nr:protein tyrosine phosphatase [Pseudomonadota bacterium]
MDDGVRTVEEGVRLCVGLSRIGYDLVVATPHIRTAMFDNRKPGLVAAYRSFLEITDGTPDMPATGLACEHFCDDMFWRLFEAGEALLYPGGKAALVEFSVEQFPLNVEQRFFQMNVRGVRPVLAHPERYGPLFRTTDPLERMLTMGVLPLLDIMSLVGRYGRKPRRAAERMLAEGVYFAACSDCHAPGDVEVVEKAIARLNTLVGREEAYELLAENPRRILEGTADEP